MYTDKVQMPAVRRQQPQAGPPQPQTPLPHPQPLRQPQPQSPQQQHNNYPAPGVQGQQPQDPQPQAYKYGQQNGYEEPQKNPYAEQAPPVMNNQQEAAYGTPVAGAPPTQTLDNSITQGHDVLAWVLFGVGFIFPVLWIVQIFLPLCRVPRFTRGNFIAWILSMVFLVIYIAAIITIAVVVVGTTQLTYMGSPCRSSHFSGLSGTQCPLF